MKYTKIFKTEADYDTFKKEMIGWYLTYRD